MPCYFVMRWDDVTTPWHAHVEVEAPVPPKGEVAIEIAVTPDVSLYGAASFAGVPYTAGEKLMIDVWGVGPLRGVR